MSTHPVTRYVRKRARREVVLEFCKQRIRIDTRSLAVFRIIAGILILVDVLLRARSFTKFYTDDGMLPLEVAWNTVPSDAVSIFLHAGDPTIVAILFGLHFLVGIQLILGYYTRFALIVSFLFVVSLDYRNVLVTSYADLTFRHLLFWAIFMPMGARFSVDALRTSRELPRQYVGLAGLFALLQMVFMYMANGSHKIFWREDWLNGNSMTGILHYDSVSFLLGPYLREFPHLMQVSGIMWYTMMLGGFLLLVFAHRARYLLAVVYAGGHLFLAVTVRIGAFPFAAIMGLTMFFQAVAWRDGKWVASRPEIPYERYYRRGRDWGDRVDSVLPTLYRREWLPKREHLVFGARVAAAFVVLVMGVFMVLPNLQTIDAVDEDLDVPLQAEVESAQASVRLLEPSWAFYQGPVTYNEYYVFIAETESGQFADVYNDRPVNWDRPHGPHNYKQLDTYRHRFFMYAIEDRGLETRTDGVLESYNGWVCDTYEYEGESIEYVNMYIINERGDIDNMGDYGNYTQRAVLLSAHACDGGEPRDLEIPPPHMTDDLSEEERAAIEAGEQSYVETVRDEDGYVGR